MSKIVLSATSPCVAEAATIALLNGGFVADTAEINYNLHTGLPSVEDVDQYPLVLEGKMAGYTTKVYVFCVTAGYGGNGPTTLVSILEAAGFYFEEADILTRKMVGPSGQISLFLRK